MTSDNAIKALMVYGLVLPAALILGYMLATPDQTTVLLLGTVLLLLLSPLLLKYHHPLLFLVWNMSTVVFFLPGQPETWLVMGFVSLGFALVQRAMDKEMRFISVPSVTIPLVVILLVTLTTAKFTGGFGLRVLGSQTVGAKAYIYIVAATVGFWAMTAQKVPEGKAGLYLGLFFLGGLPSVMSSLIPLGPKELYFLAGIFPVTNNDMTSLIGTLDPEGGFVGTITRFYGLTFTCQCGLCYVLGRYGLEGVFSWKTPWRLVLLLALLGGSCLGGYRSTLLLLVLTFVCLFFFEGLFRLKYVLILGLGLILSSAMLVPLAGKLPLPIQRSLTILPLDLNPIARYEADVSNEWRLEMWRTVWPLVPQYFWHGKGLSIDPSDLELTSELSRRGLISSQQQAILAGSYHNGGLTVLIPFGIWGALAFLWFLFAAIRALYLNLRHGEESLRLTNALIIAFFTAKVMIYFTIFGDFKTDLSFFAGLAGFSISLNGGIRKRQPAEISSAVAAEPPAELPLAANPSPSLT